jgi:hypothetical protein
MRGDVTKLPLPDSLAVAEMVRSRITVPTDALADGDVSVELYLNGRESGYAILVGSGETMVTICFAEYRNSDDIVVYCSLPGEAFEWSLNRAAALHVPTDRAFACSVRFARGLYISAASHIESLVLTALGSEAKNGSR